MTRPLLSFALALLLGASAFGTKAAAAESPLPVITTGVASAAYAAYSAQDTPRRFRLSAARPNPFSVSTRLDLTLDEASQITVAAFDALGRQVALLHEGALVAGTYALALDGSRLPPGLYIVRATDNRGVTATRSIALVR